jgi:hypothetical protein
MVIPHYTVISYVYQCGDIYGVRLEKRFMFRISAIRHARRMSRKLINLYFEVDRKTKDEFAPLAVFTNGHEWN